MIYKVEFIIKFENNKTEKHFAIFETKHEDVYIAMELFCQEFNVIYKKLKCTLDFVDMKKVNNEASNYGIICCSLKNNMKKIRIFTPSYNGKDIELNNSGYIQLPEFDRDKCWEICNWSGYSDYKPENLFSQISSCSTDIIFLNPDTEEYHIPLGFGWCIVTNKKAVCDTIKQNEVLMTVLKCRYENIKK